MVVTEFDGYHRTIQGGKAELTTDLYRLDMDGRVSIVVAAYDGKTTRAIVLSQDEAIGLASDLLRAHQLAAGHDA